MHDILGYTAHSDVNDTIPCHKQFFLAVVKGKNDAVVRGLVCNHQRNQHTIIQKQQNKYRQ